MTSYANENIEDERPSSPTSSAIYYWGGIEDEVGEEKGYADLYNETFQKRTSFSQRRRHTAGKKAYCI